MRQRPDFLWLLALVITSTLLLSNLSTKGVYSSHDGEIHIARIAQVEGALKYENPPIRWLANFNFNFGYPAFVYAYSLPYYFSSISSVATKNPEITFKLLMLLSVTFSAITFYYFAKLTLSRMAAFVGSIFYIAAPYRFADIYERGALGEALSFILVPLMFMSPYIINRNKHFGFMATTLAVFTFIGIHAITFVIFLLATVAFCPLIFKKQLKLYLYFAFAVGLGFLLASFQWMPMIFEQKYINLDKTYFHIFEGHLLSIDRLLRIPKDGVVVGTGIQLGTAQMAVTVLAVLTVLIKYLKSKKVDKYLLFFLSAIFASVFLATDFSGFAWRNFKPLATILFPWRFLIVTTFAAAYLAAYLLAKIKSGKTQTLTIALALFIAIYPSRHFLTGKSWHTYSADYYRSYQDPNKLDNYYLPEGLVQNIEDLQLAPISIVEGSGKTNLISRKNNQLEAVLEINEPAKVQLHTIYFPGWELEIDGQKSQPVTDFKNLEGIIIADVPQGSHLLSLKFTETSLRRRANLLTAASLLLLLSVLILRREKHAA